MNVLVQVDPGRYLCRACSATEPPEAERLEPFCLRSNRLEGCARCGAWIPMRLGQAGCTAVLTEVRDALVVAVEDPPAAFTDLLREGRPAWVPSPTDPLPAVPGARCRLEALAEIGTFYSGCFAASQGEDLVRSIRMLGSFMRRRREASDLRAEASRREARPDRSKVRRRALEQARSCLAEEERLLLWARTLAFHRPREARGFRTLMDAIAGRNPF